MFSRPFRFVMLQKPFVLFLLLVLLSCLHSTLEYLECLCHPFFFHAVSFNFKKNTHLQKNSSNIGINCCLWEPSCFRIWEMLSKSITPHLDKVTTTPVPRHGGDVKKSPCVLKKSFPVLKWHPLNAYWHTFCCVLKVLDFLGGRYVFLVGQFVVASHPKSDELKNSAKNLAKNLSLKVGEGDFLRFCRSSRPSTKLRVIFCWKKITKKKTDLQKWWIIISLASFYDSLIYFSSQNSLASKESLISTQPRKQSQKSPKNPKRSWLQKPNNTSDCIPSYNLWVKAFLLNFTMCQWCFHWALSLSTWILHDLEENQMNPDVWFWNNYSTPLGSMLNKPNLATFF